MKTKAFLDSVEHDKISAAIARAERASSGQIRVSVTHRAVDDVMIAARQGFARLGLERTAARNGVLLFLVPESRKFAVLGDDGIHECCGGEEFWQKLIGGTMRPLLRECRFTEAIVAAVNEMGGCWPSVSRPVPMGRVPMSCPMKRTKTSGRTTRFSV